MLEIVSLGFTLVPRKKGGIAFEKNIEYPCGEIEKFLKTLVCKLGVTIRSRVLQGVYNVGCRVGHTACAAGARC